MRGRKRKFEIVNYDEKMPKRAEEQIRRKA